jgi:hypothetical protein
MSIVLVLAGFGFLTAYIAKKRGILHAFPGDAKSSDGMCFTNWFLYGALLFLIALPHALLKRPDRATMERQKIEEEGLRKCPSCAELVKREAVVCRYCGRELPALA